MFPLPFLDPHRQDALPQRRLALDTGRTPSPPPNQRDHFGRTPEGKGLRDLPCRKMAPQRQVQQQGPTATRRPRLRPLDGHPEQRRAQPPQPAQLRTQREGSGRAEGLFRTVGGGGRHPLAEGETRSRETLLPQRLDPRTPSSDRVRPQVHGTVQGVRGRRHPPAPRKRYANRSRFRQAHESLGRAGGNR